MKVESSIWKGHKKIEFFINGRESFIVCPDKPLEGAPWAWRTEFFGAFDTADMALLNMGWYLAYHSVSDMYGCPLSVGYLNQFQNAVEKEFSLASKAVLFGFSRGGLYAFNYAVAYPEKVSLLYLDAPVLDIRSWPGGKGSGEGSPECWHDCMKLYNLTEETAKLFKENPLDKVEAVAKAGIPIIVVAGDSDRVVPYSENAAILKEKYEKAGGKIKVIVKQGVDHHPHSLDDPSPIVNFIYDDCFQP